MHPPDPAVSHRRVQIRVRAPVDECEESETRGCGRTDEGDIAAEVPKKCPGYPA
jgi:hypothetical protein